VDNSGEHDRRNREPARTVDAMGWWERRPAGWRWLVVGGVVAVLVALPGLVGAVPARDRPVAAAGLLARVLASERVAYQGYAEARAGLGLPDVPRAGRVVALLGERTRMRAFVAGPHRWRVDELTPIGERDLYADGATTLLWDSGERRATVTQGEAAVRFARPADLLPPELGRRVAAAAGAGEAARLGARRVAGVQALGLRITPRSAGTTLARADLWADAASGLPVRVELTARGQGEPIVTSTFLDLRLGAPDPGHVRFDLPGDADVERDEAPDLARAIDRFSPFVLPDPLAGEPRRTRVAGAASTYGRGFDLVAVLAFPASLSPRTRAFLDKVPTRAGPWGEASVIATPLLNGMVFEHDGVAYALAGTVTQPVLDRVAAELARDGVASR
jgi:outer membrane lipoprotein-sorting protein